MPARPVKAPLFLLGVSAFGLLLLGGVVFAIKGNYSMAVIGGFFGMLSLALALWSKSVEEQ